MLEMARDIGRNRTRREKRLYACFDRCMRCGSDDPAKRRFTGGFWRCCDLIAGTPERIDLARPFLFKLKETP